MVETVDSVWYHPIRALWNGKLLQTNSYLSYIQDFHIMYNTSQHDSFKKNNLKEIHVLTEIITVLICCPFLSLFVPYFTSPSTVTNQKGQDKK